MTLAELYKFALLELSDIEDKSFEIGFLFEEILNSSRQESLIHPNKEVDITEEKAFISAITKRKEHYPLQYILGSWEFLGMNLKVKEGVLIPREDSLVLVNAAARYIGNKEYAGLDLCAGTGAIGLGITQLCPKARVSALELFPTPFSSLKENIASYGDNRVFAHNLDVLELSSSNKFFDLDFIVSNPPYIEESEIPTLQKEVQFEPKEALDGGNDGLIFYREITKNWFSSLKTGGLLAFEIGETQGTQVAEILSQNGFIDINIISDTADHHRVVSGIKK